MLMQLKSYAPSGYCSAESIAFSRYSLAMCRDCRPTKQAWFASSTDQGGGKWRGWVMRLLAQGAAEAQDHRDHGTECDVRGDEDD
jgi:hypothetical protein